MCGIVGTFRFDGRPIDRRLLSRQVAALRHRGPDGSGIWTSAKVGLGHTRLAIIDRSDAGAQPMQTSDGSYALIYNGELYNTAELKRALRRPWPFRGRSDTEVLLYTFCDHGPSCLPRLDGIYAFAIYEAAAERLWLVRDPFGVKPLYYHHDRNRLIFSSEIRPLLLDPSAPVRPNHSALRRHVLFGYTPDPETAFADILRLPPATAMRIEANGRASVEPYWSVEELSARHSGDLETTLADSVRRQSVSDVPTGLFLSGGLDSSLLLAELARTKSISADFRAYNVGLDSDEAPSGADGRIERAAAIQSSALYGVELVRIHPSPPSTSSLPDVLASIEEPICNPSNFLIDVICHQARDHGTPVLFSGHGGDEIFGGYRRHVWARHLPRLRACGSGLAWFLERGSDGMLARRMAASLRRNAALHPLVSVAAIGWDLIEDGTLSPEFFPVDGIPAAAAPFERLLARWRGQSLLKQLMLLDLHTYLPAQNLINMDKASMRRSVEVRVPFLDRALVAIGLNAPDRELVTGFRNKVLIRKAAKHLLPASLFKAPKLGFGPPEVELMRGPEAQELLRDRRTRERGLFDQQTISLKLARLTSDAHNLALQLYGLAVIEQWFRLFIDQRPAAQCDIPQENGHTSQNEPPMIRAAVTN
jgi:asparagine synthase (glutamine-hydrolysing)